MTDNEKLRKYLSEYDFCENKPLCVCSSFKIGGKADFAVYPKNTEELVSLLAFLDSEKIRHDVFGNATNVVFDDAGYRGICIFTSAMKEITLTGANEITALCGASLTALSVFARDNSLTGLVFACGIPGSVGGGVCMNAGAYGGEINDVLLSSTVYSGGEIIELTKEEHRLGYRTSIFSENGGTVLSSRFILSPGEGSVIRGEMEEIMKKRAAKQPLEYPSAGSAFKRYPGYFTAQLIDEAGLKGFSVGGAQVSEKHAGFIINRGGATSSDVKQLVAEIKKRIREKNGIEIECEIKFIGEE